MGAVYEAEEESSGRRVAVKLIAPSSDTSEDSVGRFRQEGRLAGTITHPRCVFVLAADEEHGQPYIVMELMPGDTLQDLVRTRGPLPAQEAVAKILDVVDGLREAHRVGIIHRDIKPSNCFLEPSGRVKVGDFGLSRSLAGDARLTRTGAFLGTPLYSSPEQVRKEPLDPRSDVYSAAATLFFLLTGRAPFQGDDAVATMARVVSDPAPSARELRPGISPALDRVVQKGLERDRERRWQSLEEFRAALLPFVPGQLSIGGLGLRFGAYLLDSLVLMVISLPLTVALYAQTPEMFDWAPKPPGSPEQARQFSVVVRSFRDLWPLLVLIPTILYYGLAEGLLGWSAGKRLLGLRVCTADGSDFPGPARGLLRASVFVLLVNLGVFVQKGLALALLSENASHLEAVLSINVINLASMAGMAAGIGLVLCTMRPRNGLRGLHEFGSGTRVVRWPEPERRRALPRPRREPEPARPEGLPARVGPFEVGGALRWGAADKLLVGEDPALQRKVWVWVRPTSEPPLGEARRRSARPARLRWLASGQDGDDRWDAFVAPLGCPLGEFVRDSGRLPWPTVRPMLEQLAEELAHADEDGTAPGRLGVAQVWVQPDGSVKLLDFPFPDGGERVAAGRGDGAGESPAGQGPDRPGPAGALALLGEVAVLTLEGRPRPAGGPGPVSVPVPGYAARLLGRLLGAERPFRDVKEFRAGLEQTHDRPVTVSRGRRAGHLAVLGAFLYFGVFSMLLALAIPSITLFMASTAVGASGGRQAQSFERDAGLDCAVAAVNPDPLVRLRGLAQFGADLRQQEELREALDRARRVREAAGKNTGWFLRRYVYPSLPPVAGAPAELDGGPAGRPEDPGRADAVAVNTPAGGPGGRAADFRRAAAAASQDARLQVGPGVASVFTVMGLIMIGIWPAVWVVWAFLLRGGFSFPMVGLSLVRSDGRPASRLQCAWRAVLVWAPVFALLMGSVLLDASYWSSWEAADPAANAWVPWASWLACWAGLLLLPAYAALAVWSPERAPHDRLAGTYLVPR
jgi:uncharacterized RDD family membrane protein YckC